LPGRVAHMRKAIIGGVVGGLVMAAVVTPKKKAG
jgi:hypothetical protein